LKDYCFIFAECAEKGTGDPETEHAPHVLSRAGYEYLEQKLWLRRPRRIWRKLYSQEALMVSSTLHPRQTPREVEDGPHQENRGDND